MILTVLYKFIRMKWGLLHLGASSMPYFLAEERVCHIKRRAKANVKIEIRKNFYKKSAFTIIF